jgi:ParB/RepB/Spo0J family partition protein
MVGLETEIIAIDEIYVPAKRRGTLDEAKVETLAESILENGQQTPIHVRPDPEKSRYVLVEGLHRLEALKALGEATIDALIVMPRRS